MKRVRDGQVVTVLTRLQVRMERDGCPSWTSAVSSPYRALQLSSEVGRHFRTESKRGDQRFPLVLSLCLQFPASRSASC